MTTFNATLPAPTPAAGVAIPFTHMTTVRDNALALYYGRWSQVDISTTGTVNDHAPAEGCIVRCANASALTITGIVPNQDGEIRVYNNVGASTVKFTHQDSGSAATNRLLLPSTAGQWIGPNGSLGLRYDGTTDRWRVLFIEPGAPISYTPTYGGAGSLTWTSVTTNTAAYQQHGNLLWSSYFVSGTLGGTTNAYATISLPSGMTWALTQNVSGHGLEVAAAITINGILQVSTSELRVYKADTSANWTLGTNLVRLTGQGYIA